MIVAAGAPAGADRLEFVGLAVAVAIAQAADFGALGEPQRVVFPEHPERLVQSVGELRPTDFRKVLLIRAGGDPQVAAAGGDGELLARHQGDGADLHHLAGRQRDLLAEVVVGLVRGGEAGGEDESGECAHGGG